MIVPAESLEPDQTGDTTSGQQETQCHCKLMTLRAVMHKYDREKRPVMRPMVQPVGGWHVTSTYDQNDAKKQESRISSLLTKSG